MTAKWLGLLTVMAAVLAAAGCGDDDSDGTDTASTGKAPLGTPSNRGLLGKLNPRNLSPCYVRLGGGNVRITGVSCEEVRDALRHWKTAPVYYKRRGESRGPAAGPQERVFDQPGGWTCYGRLHKELQVIRNVCFRGSAVVVYTVF